MPLARRRGPRQLARLQELRPAPQATPLQRPAPTPAQPPPAVLPARAVHPAQPMQVTLKFSADSWVEIYDSKGEKLFYDIGSANSQNVALQARRRSG